MLQDFGNARSYIIGRNLGTVMILYHTKYLDAHAKHTATPFSGTVLILLACNGHRHSSPFSLLAAECHHTGTSTALYSTYTRT